MRKQKNLFGILTLFALIAWAGIAMAGNPFYTDRVFNAEALTASGTSTSDPINLNNRANMGFFCLQYTISGSGTVKIEYLLSIDGTNYNEPSTAVDIGSGLTAATGQLLSFEPEPAQFMKIKITETGGASTATVTIDLFIQ